jgi:transcriptional regulator with XRE-family HTH domain
MSKSMETFARDFRAKGFRGTSASESAGKAGIKLSRGLMGPAKKRKLERYRLESRLKAAHNRIAALEAELGRQRDGNRPDWLALCLEVQRLLLTRPQPGRISTIALATAMGVSEKLAYKWLRGQCRPKPEMQDRILRWYRKVTRVRTEPRRPTWDGAIAKR